MMKTTKTKIRNWKWASLAPLVVILLIAFSCNDEAMNDLEKVSAETAVAVEIPDDIYEQMQKLKEEYPGAEFEYLETTADNLDELERLKDIDPNTIAMVDVNKDENRIGIIVRKNGVMERVAGATGDGETFTVVEQTATPIGGMAAFYQYIAENLEYPAEAKQKGIEGKVYIQMVIDTDGSITEVVPVKGIGGGADEEAVRVISQAPAWTPAEQRGKKVKQKIVVPIVFALGNEGGQNNSSIPAQVPVAINDQMTLEIQTLDNNPDGTSVGGTVYGKDGKALPGVNVVIGGTTRGTVTDLDGKFRIQLDRKGQELFFSYVGYETVKKTIE